MVQSEQTPRTSTVHKALGPRKLPWKAVHCATPDKALELCRPLVVVILDALQVCGTHVRKGKRHLKEGKKLLDRADAQLEILLPKVPKEIDCKKLLHTCVAIGLRELGVNQLRRLEQGMLLGVRPQQLSAECQFIICQIEAATDKFKKAAVSKLKIRLNELRLRVVEMCSAATSDPPALQESLEEAIKRSEEALDSCHLRPPELWHLDNARYGMLKRGMVEHIRDAQDPSGTSETRVGELTKLLAKLPKITLINLSSGRTPFRPEALLEDEKEADRLEANCEVVDRLIREAIEKKVREATEKKVREATEKKVTV